MGAMSSFGASVRLERQIGPWQTPFSTCSGSYGNRHVITVPVVQCAELLLLQNDDTSSESKKFIRRKKVTEITLLFAKEYIHKLLKNKPPKNTCVETNEYCLLVYFDVEKHTTFKKQLIYSWKLIENKMESI